MLKIRLRRTGSRHQPSYRVVVADSRSARDGSFVDYIGHYNPRTDPPTVEIDYEKAERGISNGAQPTDVVKGLLKNTSKNNDSEEAV